jgi:hypothetical protein
LLEPRLESRHQHLALVLSHPAALIGGYPADRLLDRIEFCNAFECLARDRSVAALGDVEELAAQMCPAEGKRNRLAGCGSGDRLVGGITVALHDAAILIEEL